MITQLLGLDQKVPDIVGRPGIARIETAPEQEAAGPVGKRARGYLEPAQALDTRLHVALDLLLARVLELDQRRQVKLREDRGGHLLDAAVGISY